jgi:hypothetical protein
MARLIYALALSALLVGCDDSDSSVADAAVCGTHSNPGILTLSNLAPALGASVPNRNIVHRFTVVNAPGDYYDFDLVYGDRHTAGVATPQDPRFQTSIAGSDVKYELVIDGWSNAPAHVVLNAGGSYDTSKGCAWVFPSPLFEYDITAVGTPDGGAMPDTKPGVDGLGWPIGPGPLDTARAPDAAVPEVTSPVEVSSEAAARLDVAQVDAGDVDSI